MCVVKAEVYPEVQQVAIALDKTDLEPHQSLKGKWLGTLFANLAIVHLADVCLSPLVHWCHVLAFFFVHQTAIHKSGLIKFLDAVL